MDFEVSSKRQQRGILTGLLLGRSFRRQSNFGIEHQNPELEYIAFKRSLLAQVTGRAVALRQWQTRNGHQMIQLLPTQIPLSRVLVQRLYRGNHKVIRTTLLTGLTPPGLALWFMDRGSRHYIHQRKTQTIKGVELYLNTLTPQAESETIAAYFRERWDIHWGLIRYHHRYRLRLGTQASRQFFELIAPYVLPSLKPLLDPSDNRTATA
ncbi:MAG: DNA endonuclease [Spirulina sp. SIO3F2]|nr:DNA endonuclease [Spirulina sp. SIO3F2]